MRLKRKRRGPECMPKKDMRALFVSPWPSISPALASKSGGCFRLIITFHALGNDFAGFFGACPIADLHPFSFFQVFIVLEEMRDLLVENFRQVGIALNIVIK